MSFGLFVVNPAAVSPVPTTYPAARPKAELRLHRLVRIADSLHREGHEEREDKKGTHPLCSSTFRPTSESERKLVMCPVTLSVLPSMWMGDPQGPLVVIISYKLKGSSPTCLIQFRSQLTADGFSAPWRVTSIPKTLPAFKSDSAVPN